MLTVFYIIGCTLMFLFFLSLIYQSPPDSKEQCQTVALRVLLATVLWPGFIVFILLVHLIEWISVIKE